MLKTGGLVKIEQEAAKALRRLLEQVPIIGHLDVEQVRRRGTGHGADLVARLEASGRRHTLVCEVKSSGQPRHVRPALLQLRDHIAREMSGAVPVFIAPYLSPETRALCDEYEVGFVDLEGNARLAFDGVFIDRQVASKPAAERRELRSLFKPKSAQILRLMLRQPSRAWRVVGLAEAAGVSLGHVSNVRSGLLDREWAQVSDEGLLLSDPDALLDAWREAYEPPAGRRHDFYTTLHGEAFDKIVRELHPAPDAGLTALASFSAGQWLAPYGRIGTQYFYADETGLARLCVALKLSAAVKGENVAVTVLEEPGVFRDTVEPAPGVICTSPVQTYLDLTVAGERGREAADHLRQERLQWRK
ncbi:MAG: type IV toxin-antitoxin system AbiEi family antitoxin [Burkholderiaceae bacterium]